jgi:hypothetical protein
VIAALTRPKYDSKRETEICGGKAVGKQASKKKTRNEPVGISTAAHGSGSALDEFDWRTFDPASLKGGVEAPLATELVTYRDCLDELLSHEGQYVMIKGQEIAGYFLDRESAVAAAIARYGRGPVLVKRIVERQPVHRIGHASL